MKNFNLLRKSERKSVGTTLALTVGSPSFDRRGTMLKHYAFMLLFLLGSLNVWGEDVTCTLSNANIVAEGAGATGYGAKSMTDGCDQTWNAYAIKNQHSKATSDYHFLQIRKYNNPTAYYIQVPEKSGYTIKSITMVVSGSSAARGSGGNTATLYFSASNSTSAKGNGVVSGTGASSVTIDCSSLELATGYITAGGAVRIWGDVVVTYTPASSSCDKKVNITAGTTTNGTFDLSKTGEAATCDAAVEVTVTPHPAEHFEVDKVTASNDGSVSGPNGEGEYTVTYAQDYNNSSEINVTFKQKDQYTVTWNNHGLISTSQVYEGEKPVFPETPTSCDATSTTFIGWATKNWTGKLADLAGKTVYISAAAMPAVTGPVEYFAVYAKATAGAEEEHEGPSFSRSGSNDTYTTGYTFSAQAEGKTGYYQDGSGDLRYIQVLNATTPIFSATPNRVTVTAKIGGGTGGKDLTDPVQAQLLDNTGAPITGAVVAITSHITTATGDTYADIEIPTAGITSAYGVRISHQKQSGYNVRYYSFSLKYYTGGATYSDYMTTCAAEGTCEAPSFSPAAGTFDEARDITLQTSTPSAHIYYTLDGTDPDDGSAEYSTPIPITQNTTIKAITYADGLTKSSISTGVFNIRYAQPTFSPAGGDYDVAQNVIISADGAEHIYYTINGDDPIVDPANLYDGSAIAINTTGSHTIKAIAVKAGYANSNVASATYVMDLPYGSIAEFVTAKPNTAKDLVFEEADNCVITGINGNSVYVQDASGKGMIIFNKSGYGALEFHVGDRIVGTVNGKYQAFNGQHEMSLAVFAEGVTFTAVSRPTPVPVTAIDETAFNANSQILVKIEDLYYKSSSDKTHKFATAGGSTEYTIYDQFGIMSGKTMPETSVACNLTGILSVYNTTYQLLPVFATDIVADADAAAPTVSPAGGADAENAVTAAAVEITAAAGTKVDGLASKTVDINSVIPTEVTVEVTRDFYRPVNYSCGWYKAAAAKYNINGQGETTEGTVVAKVAGVEAATAAEGDEVHVFITPNTHFHLATILVNDAAPAKVVEGAEYSFTMPDAAVTIAVTWTEDAKATLTFAKGEANSEEAAPGNIVDYIGETVLLPANPFTYTGHKFVGWSCDGGTTKLAAGANYVLAEDKAFVAQWDEIPTFDNSGYEWQLVTSDAQLVAGKYYVIASTAKGKVMSNTISSNVAGEIAATFTDGVIAYNAFGSSSQSADVAGVAVLQLGGEEGAWTLTEVVANDALLGATAEKKLAWGSGTTTWSISIASANANATIQNGTSSYGRFLHNVNGTRFTTYTSNTNVSMLLPQLYVWAEKVYKLRYDANGGENAPAAQAADGEGKATVTDVKPTYTDHIFNGWNTLVGGNGEAKAAGDVIDLSAGDVTLYAQWREPNTYSISYDANGGTLIEGESEITPTSVTEGNAYTIEENVYEVEGKLFIGWKANGVTYNAGQEIYPTENMTFVAQWGDPNVTDFMLVTDVKQLKDGDKVYIVAADDNVAMGTQNGNYRNYVEIAKQNNRVVILNATPVEFTVGKDGDNFTFNDGTGYLYASSSDKNYLNTEADLDNNGKWAISINANGVASIIAQGANENNNLKWNNNSPRFSCYKSGQKAVSIYKRPDYSRNVSGNYATICLPKAGKIIGATLYEIAYYGETSKKIFFDEIVNGEMEAGIPYIFQPAAGVEKINVYYSDNTVADVDARDRNGLIGFYDLTNPEATHDITRDEGYYILYNNQYWLVSGRKAYVENYRAYIRLADITPSEPTLAPGRRRISMSVNDTQTTTGFENAEANEAPRKVLINGELFILRGEKVYDAKGQLVK